MCCGSSSSSKKKAVNSLRTVQSSNYHEIAKERVTASMTMEEGGPKEGGRITLPSRIPKSRFLLKILESKTNELSKEGQTEGEDSSEYPQK